MYSLLLTVIYIAFISLGLPDSLLGSAWPVMGAELSVPLSYAGVVSTLIAMGTVIASLLSDRATKRFGAGAVTSVSVLLTAVALFGFSASGSFVVLCLFALPYGLGAGAVDAALNNFVALNYSSRHMSWLHCFWGVGTVISPAIMGQCLANGSGWTAGYRTISLIQIGITALLFVSLPMWKKVGGSISGPQRGKRAKSLPEIFKIPGVKYVLLAFFAYCGAESTVGLWASSYLVLHKGIDDQLAARFGALFFIGITAGRFLTGFVADTLGDKNLIRLGVGVMALGVAIVWLPVGTAYVSLAGLVCIGLGCAPVYPAIIHSTPFNFGKENSQAIIGVQMASAYVGNIFIPPLFGVVAQNIGIYLFPVYLIALVALLCIMTEQLNRNRSKQPG